MTSQAGLAGVDGCKAGWVVIWDETPLRIEIVSTFSEVASITASCAVVAVDMPIGLPSTAARGGRPCDAAARRVLRGRAASVFSAPPRHVLDASSYQEALERCRLDGVGLSIQAFHLVPKIRQIDAALAGNAGRFFEAHPELAFLQLSGSVLPSKHSKEGLDLRRTLLSEEFAIPPTPQGAKTDDMLDALVLVHTARRIHANAAVKLGGDPDETGLEMAIWY
ncbi:MAG: DUF429 domain-containing protein [bacterium]